MRPQYYQVAADSLIETVHRELENLRDGHEPKSPVEEQLIRLLHATVSVLILTRSDGRPLQLEFSFMPQDDVVGRPGQR